MMKILFISMPSIHIIRWIENLENSGHELFWFDVLGRGKLQINIPINQITNWKKRKIPHIKGEYFLSKKYPRLYNTLHPFLEITANEKLAQIIEEIQPDVVHSFEMQSCSYPILNTMNKFQNLKWLYSCWGSDLYYYQKFSNHRTKIQSVLERVNYLHTDCLRDFNLSKEMGFRGKHLGVIPGGAGYKIREFEKYKLPISERKIILIKGYEHKFGRALNIIKAMELLPEVFKKYDIVVFGAHLIVKNYIYQNNLPFKVYDRNELQHSEVLQLMGESIVYIGNNISDGMSNTLLEAIVMGAFPIQSNPGKVSAEIIMNQKNGLLIENPEDFTLIKSIIMYAFSDSIDFENAQNINSKLLEERLEFEICRQKILNLYQNIVI